MDLGIAWTIARKDLGIFRKKRSVFYSAVLLPLIMSFGFSGVILYLEQRGRLPGSGLTALLDAFSFFFIIIASVIPMGISSYSIIGEKVEKSLEPLLATPATDSEILLGKGLASFIPAIVITYISLTLYMILTDILTYGQLGFLYYPNWTAGTLFLLVAPLTILLGVGVNVLISSRVSDVRTATQLGALVSAPLGVIYVASEVGIIKLDIPTLLIIAVILAVCDVVFLYLSKATFQREEILTKWK